MDEEDPSRVQRRSARPFNLYMHQLEKARVSMMNPLTEGFGGIYPGQHVAFRLMLPLLRREEESTPSTRMSLLAIARKSP